MESLTRCPQPKQVTETVDTSAVHGSSSSFFFRAAAGRLRISTGILNEQEKSAAKTSKWYEINLGLSMGTSTL